MIRKFIGRMLGRGHTQRTQTVRRISASEHNITANDVSYAARNVIEKLQHAGFEAYVVGGAVRDLLLGKHPKDFDVATNATPEQIVRLFRRARIIGRRFRIVHVIIERETIEVTTLRGGNDNKPTDEHGRILNDNTFGTIDEDAVRRDFTVNAMYFDPHSGVIFDFHDGLADLTKKQLRMIGDPAQRYREDPVRMLRAIRLAAKLDLNIEAKTREPIRALSLLMRNVPEARLFDEILKLLVSGCAMACLRRLRDEGLGDGLLPLVDTVLNHENGQHFVEKALANTDARLAVGKSISPAFLFATLLWPQVRQTALYLEQQEQQKPWPALMQAINTTLDAVDGISIPRRFEADMREIWMMQPRFEQCVGQRPFKLLEHPRFRAGYDFMLLRAETDEIPLAFGPWWTSFQEASSEEKQQLIQSPPLSQPHTATTPSPRKNQRRRRHNKPHTPPIAVADS